MMMRTTKVMCTARSHTNPGGKKRRFASLKWLTRDQYAEYPVATHGSAEFKKNAPVQRMMRNPKPGGAAARLFP